MKMNAVFICFWKIFRVLVNLGAIAHMVNQPLLTLAPAVVIRVLLKVSSNFRTILVSK